MVSNMKESVQERGDYMSQRDKSDDALTTVCNIEEAIRFSEMMLESFYERMNRLQLMLAKSKGPGGRSRALGGHSD